MANEAKIYKTIDAIEGNLACWSQRHFANGHVRELPSSWPTCGTTFCIAGWQCIVDGLRPCVGDHGHVYSVFLDDRGIKYSAYEWAKSSMELTRKEADLLFFATVPVTDIVDLRWVAAQIIAGKVDHIIECDNRGRCGCRDCHGGLRLVSDDN